MEKAPNDAVFSSTPSAFTRMVSDTPPLTGAAGAIGDFTYSAEKVRPAVVHIKTKMTCNVSRQMMDPFEDFFGGFGGGGRRQQPEAQEASGSGVIISADGYIVTNNHVVQGADEVSVILNDKRELKAKVISTDPSSDIAVIQVKSTNLPFLTFGDSDNLKVGEWVLAVGNPFNLESTVTAGIMSAKGRSNIIDRTDKDMNPLESFIQTDAAVNPGNSGGALVNLKGELVGINTAIYSRTGQFAGYSFAVPVSIVKKVAADLIKFGNVQRGFLGVNIQEVNSKLVQEKDLKVNDGVYVGGFPVGGSSAQSAGLKVNDVIVKVDGVPTSSSSKLMELVGRKRPGETVVVTVNRDGDIKDFNVTLKNKEGNTNIVKGEVSSAIESAFLGAKLANLTAGDREKYGVANGVKLTEVDPNGRFGSQGFERGFVITKIDDKGVTNAKDVAEMLSSRKGKIKIEGIDTDGTRVIMVL
ncbi:MAG: Do family serine endopeptidase [Arcicella sp.]|nr:Do family serine endopeptidase [Arcicella sp.]